MTRRRSVVLGWLLLLLLPASALGLISWADSANALRVQANASGAAANAGLGAARLGAADEQGGEVASLAAAREAGLFNTAMARCLGPANFGGRVTDIAVLESNTDVVYVAAATGGIWKTTDGGGNWRPVFDEAGSLCIGAVAVSQSQPDVVWVGTGEGNILRSVSIGDGVYKTTDGGKTWKHMGLKETRHISRIVVHPTNPDIVYVAALGRAFGSNSERGVFKTNDGGKSWEKVLYIDDTTGATDLAMDPSEPNNLYACAYTFRRDAFSGSTPRTQYGLNAGIYRSSDGGKTWDQAKNGLPDRPMGRCGISVYRKDPNVVFAIVQTDKSQGKGFGGGGGKGGKGGFGGKGGGKGPDKAGDKDKAGKDKAGKDKTDKDKGDKDKTDKDKADKEKSAKDTTDKAKVAKDENLGGIYRSSDKGKTWKHVSSFFPTLGFYFGQIRVDPNDDQHIIVLAVQIHVSTDGGKTFGNSGGGAHSDNHALWIDPKNSDNMALGNDGGLYFSKNKGKNWKQDHGLSTAQFYGVAVDMRKPYHVAGGLQDNGTWGGPSATDNDVGITTKDWYNIGGADGFRAQIDPTDFNIVYFESQEGGLQRANLKDRLGMAGGKGGGMGGGGKGNNIRPQGGRYNWNSPILISPHDPKMVFFGGQYLFRSANRGDKWEKASPDLTRGGEAKDTGHTITTIAESPIKAGLYWVGTDDGRLHVTTNGGKDWIEVTKAVPTLAKDISWVTCVEASHFAEGAAYLTVDRHRNNDLRPYLYRTTDYGETWIPVNGNLPVEGNLHCVRESSKNANLLFVGTEFGLYASLDGGQHWHNMKTGLPKAVLVHDMVIHPRDRDLVIATHARGIYAVDIWPVEQLTPNVLASDVHLFNVRPARAFKVKKTDPKDVSGFVGPNPAYGATIYYLLQNAVKQPVTISILGNDGKSTLAVLEGSQSAGLQKVAWNLRAEEGAEELVAPGNYTARLRVGERTWTAAITVEAGEEGAGKKEK